MIGEAIAQVFVEALFYPIFYFIGFISLKTMTLGNANVLPLCERGYEKQMRWYQFFVRRSGRRFWIPESVILVGFFVSVLIGIAVYSIFNVL